MNRTTFLVGFTVISLFYIIAPAQAFENSPIGWATMSDGNVPYTITGGSAGDTVTVTNETDLKSYAQSDTAYVIIVPTTIICTQGSQKVNIHSNKTIIGIGSNPGIYGYLNISGAYNIIIRNLNVWYEDANQGCDNPNTDGITIQNGAHHVWVDHCNFFDSPDGLVDPTKQSDYITISWCKFYYNPPPTGQNTCHRNCNLVGSADGTPADVGKLKETFHHNWWGNLCGARMPRVRYGQVHVFNNYYSCSGNSYCVGVGYDCQILLEDNYFNNVNVPWYNWNPGDHQGLIHWNSGNVFVGTTIPTWAPNSTVFTPPYSYTLDSGADVNTIVQNGAGVGKIGGDITSPATPTGLTATAGYATVVLDWNDNNEPDRAGYNVYRSTSSPGGYSKLNGSLLSDSNYVDNTVPHDTTYYYVVKAVDTNSNESNPSDEVFSGLYGDFTGNGIVEMNDLPDFLDFWLADDCDETYWLDLDDNCIVNFYEFSVLAQNWLKN